MLGVSPAGIAVQGAGSSPANVQVDSLREALQAANYSVGPPLAWSDQAVVVEARSGDRIVRAFVYRDAQAASAAYRTASAQQAASANGTLAYSDDAGPQLLSGFGASAWRRNVALVQSSPAVFGELMPQDVDCTDLAPSTGPDLSRPLYRVDPTLVALVDSLT